MKSRKQEIYNRLPMFFKNILVTMHNLYFIHTRRSEYRSQIRKYHHAFYDLTYEEILELQNQRFMELVNFLDKHNTHYQNILCDLEIQSIDNIGKFPILTKDDLRSDSIKSDINDKLYAGYTGGTTGKSLEYALTKSDYIERQACVDFFRGMYGYRFRDEIAWFSGKELISDREVIKGVFWVRDYINNITYYSTFHLADSHIDKMIDNLVRTKPGFLAGFPSSIYDIARRWKSSGRPLDINLKTIFPTSEPLLDYQKAFLIEFFDCPVPDQYAASEGAPFIYECPHGSLHYDMYSGVFEKLNEFDTESEYLVTSFTTHYMPLVRYQIGDSFSFADKSERCNCGSSMPLVNKIIGRSVAFVYSKERGKVTVSNISNVVKYLGVINKLQLIQDDLDSITVRVVCPDCNINKITNDLEYELRFRLGDEMKFKYEFVDHIANEANGKFLMLKNSLSENCY